LRTQECRVTLDFTHAVITSNVLRIETDMVHGKLVIVSSPGFVIDTDGLNLTYSKLKLHSKNAAAAPRFLIELVGKLLHAKVIEQRPGRRPRCMERYVCSRMAPGGTLGTPTPPQRRPAWGGAEAMRNGRGPIRASISRVPIKLTSDCWVQTEPSCRV